MGLIRSRVVLAAGLCAATVATIGTSMAGATTTPPEDTSSATTASGAPATSDAAETTEAIVADAGVEILPPDESWGGATRGEWDARWWQWAASMPEAVNPNFDATGERCGYGQSGPVFFMPASFTFEASDERLTCVIAEGIAIYVPVVGIECSTVEPPPFFGRDEEELLACATAGMADAVEYSTTINGQDVGDLDPYLTTSPLFTLTFPEDNIFGVEPGVANAVSAVYSFLIAPPPPGEYEITGSTRFATETEPFSRTMTLVVEAAQVVEPTPSSEPESTGPVETSVASSSEPVDDTTVPATSAVETTTA